MSGWATLLCAVAATGVLNPWVTHSVAAGYIEHSETAGRRGRAGPSLSSLPSVADPGPCAPPSNSSAPVGLRGYGRFHANDSLIGRPVPCTQDDKICFRHNLLFDPKLDVCQPIGGDGHSSHCDLAPDRTEFEQRSGRIIGVCKIYEDLCPGYRMAFDGRCYRKEIVRDVLCGCRAKPTRHFLDGVECRTSPPRPRIVQQPEEEGHCLIPDLRFPDIERSNFFRNPFTSIQGFRGTRTGISSKKKTPSLICEPAQAACFSKGKVWVSGSKGCYDLLKKGPCPKDHVVVMDTEAAFQGDAKTTCEHVRGGCPSGYRRMVFDGQCHEVRELKVGAPGNIVRNQYGHFVLIPHGFVISFRPQSKDGICKIHYSAVGSGVGEAKLKPKCGANNKDQCHLFEVISEPPKPEF